MPLAFFWFPCVVIFKAVSRPADEQNGHRRWPCVLQRVRVPARNENGITRLDHSRFAPDSHSSRALQDVVNLFCLKVMMPPDARTRGQNFFGETASFDV